MPYNPDLHHRRSIRLQGHDDVSEGAYFVTICTAQRQRLFGEVIDGNIHENALYWESGDLYGMDNLS